MWQTSKLETICRLPGNAPNNNTIHCLLELHTSRNHEASADNHQVIFKIHSQIRAISHSSGIAHRHRILFTSITAGSRTPTS
jgi:hypothetical protein